MQTARLRLRPRTLADLVAVIAAGRPVGLIVALLHPDNTASRHVAEKIGRRLSGDTGFIKAVRQLV